MRFILYSSFLIIGLVSAMLGPLVPFLRADLNLSYGLAGLFFSFQSIGALCVLVLGGWLMHSLGSRRVVAIGLLVFCSGLLATALAGSFALILVANLLIGAGMSFLDMGISTVCIDANPTGKGKALNKLHFFFGAGAVFGPLLALVVGALPGGWRWAFGLTALGPVVIAVVLLMVHFPPPAPATVAERFGVYRKPLLWLGGLAMCIYCGVEWGVGAWFPSYWQAIPGTSKLSPAWATSLFWLTFAIGRSVQGGKADKWGFQPFLALGTVLTLVVLILWIIFPSPAAAIAWVLCFGFLIAGMYPTIVALVSHRFPASSGQLTPILSIFASIGGLLWPPAIGAIADKAGMAVLPWTQLVLTILMAIGLGLTFLADRREAIKQAA